MPSTNVSPHELRQEEIYDARSLMPGDAIAEIFRVLKPAGRALFHIPVTDHQGTIDWLARWRDPVAWQCVMDDAGHDHSVMLTRAGYEAVTRDVGFRIIASHRYNAMLQNVFDYRMIHRVLNRLFFIWKAPFTLYHKAIAPLIEIAMSPDRLLAAADIGASIYLVVERPADLKHS
jgi:SAM-dependent methyltransferase